MKVCYLLSCCCLFVKVLRRFDFDVAAAGGLVVAPAATVFFEGIGKVSF